jgi:hypothetical protein
VKNTQLKDTKLSFPDEGFNPVIKRDKIQRITMVAYFRLRRAPIKFPQSAQPLRNVIPYSFKKERRDISILILTEKL